MKWVLSHATDELHHWLLQLEKGSRSLTLNLQRLSLRIAGLSKRLFFLQVQGFLQKKVVLCSEYGVSLGETVFTEQPSQGQLVLNEQKFFYKLKDDRLMLMDGEKNNIGESEILQKEAQRGYEFYSLLFGFAWFLTNDAAKTQVLPVTA